MSMTRSEYITRDYLQNKLAKEGYPTYGKLLGNFDLNITNNPSVIGYMEPQKGRIVLNSGLDENQVSVVIRHEILHQFLEHERRLLKKLCNEHGLDFDKVDDNSLEDIKRKLYSNKLFNVAADYEISNRGYTDKDKDTIRNILLNGEVLSGLVTEDEHPDWVDMSVEEMYDLLRNENQQDQEQNQEGSNEQQNQDQQGEQGESSSSSQSFSGQNDQQDQDQSDNQSDSSSNQQDQSDDSDNEGSNIENNLDSDDSEDSNDSSSSSNNSSQQDKNDSSEDSSSSSKGDDSKDDSSSENDNSAEAQSGNPDNSENGKQSKSRPQIGDKGDEEFTRKEDEERERQAAEEAKEYDLPSESEEERQERLKKIQREINDTSTARSISGEAEDKIKSEKAKKAARDSAKYTNSPIKRFRDNLNRFIRNEVGRERTRTWKKENPSYEGSGIMRRGKARTSNGKIPLINVYFDRSGSWDAAKTQVGQDAIATLNNYVRNGQIKINLYYFNTQIHSEDPGGRGGTRGTPIVEHIKQTKPDNVIIMTDDDIYDIDESVTVPGAVWLLFKGGVSKNLIDHIRGRKQTNIYNLD